MLYRKANGQPPSLRVEDRKEFTLTVQQAEVTGLSTITLRPRTVGALMLICGIPPKRPPRLSDASAFEKLQSISGFVDVGQPDPDRRLDGYSPAFLRKVLQSFDPEAPMPASVKWQVPHRNYGEALKNSHAIESRDSVSCEPAPIYHKQVSHIEMEVPVPTLLRDYRLVIRALSFENIVIGFDSTLVVSPDVHAIVAGSILCYTGAQLQQQSPNLIVDLSGTLRGSIVSRIDQVSHGLLRIDWTGLNELPVKKL